MAEILTTASSTTTKVRTKDVRLLEITEVCNLRDWVTRYVRLENPEVNDSKQLVNLFVRNSREYESDLGVFGVDE